MKTTNKEIINAIIALVLVALVAIVFYWLGQGNALSVKSNKPTGQAVAPTTKNEPDISNDKNELSSDAQLKPIFDYVVGKLQLVKKFLPAAKVQETGEQNIIFIYGFDRNDNSAYTESAKAKCVEILADKRFDEYESENASKALDILSFMFDFETSGYNWERNEYMSGAATVSGYETYLIKDQHIFCKDNSTLASHEICCGRYKHDLLPSPF